MTLSARTLLALALAAALSEGCTCRPTEECQLVRALCKIEVCARTDPAGWEDCALLPAACDGIETSCATRGECMAGFLERCAARMVPWEPGYEAYAACARLDCAARPQLQTGQNRSPQQD